MEPQDLKNIIESILFVSNKPLHIKDFVKLLDQQAFAVQNALDQLMNERKTCGIVVLENNGEYQLATNSANVEIVKNFLNAELREKLTDATVEVLAIITYRQPISKAEIEAIRGVNSQYSIRQLLMRGMIQKTANPNDARGFLYETTTEFLQHMGLVSMKDLPEFDKLVGDIKLPEAPAIPVIEPSEETINNEPMNQHDESVDEEMASPDITPAQAADPELVPPAPGTMDVVEDEYNRPADSDVE